MVPWTPHGLADDQPFTERTTVVAADRPDRKPLWIPTNEKNRLATSMSSEHAGLRDIAEGDAGLEVRARQWCG
jgi:hypothetical protein